jgi:hypothetical protein
MNAVSERKLLGDLEARIAATDDHNGSFGDMGRAAVARAVCLKDLRREVASECGHARGLERTCRNHDLLGLDGTSSKVEDEATVCGYDRPDRTVELDSQFKG